MEAKSIVAILMEARALIEAGWCQKHYSVDANGHTSAEVRDAVAFCTMGAVYAVHRFSRTPNIAASLDILQGQLPRKEMKLVDWNDEPDRTKEDVLALYDRAIAQAETLDEESIPA